MRRLPALLLVLALAVAACSKTDRPPIERVAGTIGASDGATDGGASEGAAINGTTTGGADGSVADGPTGGAVGQSTGSSTSVVAGTDANDEADADASARAQIATAALDAYLDALKAEDFAAAQRASTGGAAFMARVRDVVSRYNKERDGVTTLSYSARSFRVASSGATQVTFTGEARLESSTSGPAGSPSKASAQFENPVVSFSNGAWRVVDFRYDGQPLGHFPATSRKALGGVDLRLPGALSFGESTGLIVDLVSDGDHSIKIDQARLHYADGSAAAPQFGVLISKKPAALYFLFDRGSSTPTSWTAAVTIDGGTDHEAKADVVLSFR